MDFFNFSGDRAEGFNTPDINDFFIKAAGTPKDTRDLSAISKFSTAKEALISGVVAKGHPIPFARPRCIVIIPPILMPAFCGDQCPENILLLLLVCHELISCLAAENFSEEGTTDLWIACFPTLQLKDF